MEPITALSGWLQTLLGLAGRAVLLTMFPEVAVLHFRRRTGGSSRCTRSAGGCDQDDFAAASRSAVT